MLLSLQTDMTADRQDSCRHNTPPWHSLTAVMSCHLVMSCHIMSWHGMARCPRLQTGYSTPDRQLTSAATWHSPITWHSLSANKSSCHVMSWHGAPDSRQATVLYSRQTIDFCSDMALPHHMALLECNQVILSCHVMARCPRVQTPDRLLYCTPDRQLTSAAT